jgi:hypothetical protein
MKKKWLNQLLVYWECDEEVGEYTWNRKEKFLIKVLNSLWTIDFGVNLILFKVFVL